MVSEPGFDNAAPVAPISVTHTTESSAIDCDQLKLFSLYASTDNSTGSTTHYSASELREGPLFSLWVNKLYRGTGLEPNYLPLFLPFGLKLSRNLNSYIQPSGRFCLNTPLHIPPIVYLLALQVYMSQN